MIKGNSLRHFWIYSIKCSLTKRPGVLTPDLLVTQRSDDKDICPAFWDLSAAEHQKPGETGFETAFRGLREELGIHSACLRQSLGWSRHRMAYPELGIIDYEETATFSTRYAGDLRFEDGEVMASRWIARSQIGLFMKHEKTTPWMQRDLHMLNLIVQLDAE